MNEKIIMQNPELCPHGNQIGMCDVCGGESVKKLEKKELTEYEVAPEDWMTNKALATKMSVGDRTVKNIANKYREVHPEWFKKYKISTGRVCEHYAPKLIMLVEENLLEREDAPENWITNKALAKKLSVDNYIIKDIANEYREVHPEWFKKYRVSKGSVYEHYAPELISIIEEKINKENAPGNWVINGILAKKLLVGNSTIKDIANKYRKVHPEWFKEYRISTGRMCEHYSPELISLIEKELLSKEDAPEDWMTNNALGEKLTVSGHAIKVIANKYREAHPEWFEEYKALNGSLCEHYSPELISLIEKELLSKEDAPKNWMTNRGLADKLSVDKGTVKVIANKYREAHPEWFEEYRSPNGSVYEHYAPELVVKIREYFGAKKDLQNKHKKQEEFDGEIIKSAVTLGELANILGEDENSIKWYVEFNYDKDSHPELYIGELYTQKLAQLIKKYFIKQKEYRMVQPEGGMTAKELAGRIDVKNKTIRQYVYKYYHKKNYPELHVGKYYTKELVDIITEHYDKKRAVQEDKDQQVELKNSLENTLTKIGNNSDSELKKIISLFNGAQAVDILFHFRPEFKGLPVEYVKSKLAEYLGDFMVERKPLNFDDLSTHVEMLSVATFRNSMLEVIKRDCLSFYNEQKRNDNTKSEREIFNGYIEYVIEKVGDIKSKELDDIIERVEEYYDEVLQQQKPDNIVSSLREERIFPDINQMINIKEISDKKRMLIADEMGLGKSASAILAKEYLGCSCALIAVPSNVVSTWEEYLSSDVDDETGKQKGYFKEGLEPRVLTINSQEDIEKMYSGVWDYVIVSHEKLNDTYMEALSELGNDMLIVDEVHKMKNTKGVRAKNVQILSEQIEGDNQYLSILSGTPVPNKVDDLVMTLRLLYPEEFGVEKIDNKTLVQNIINGDLLDLRNVLVPRMQMKRLEESIEMPELRENISYIEMSQEQKDIYEVLMEEDEVTASQKMQVLRQFLLNPALLDSTPNITSPKIEAFANGLEKSFETKDKIVVFVNSYVEGVIRGKNGIQEQLEERLKGVELYSVHGKDNEESKFSKVEYRSMIKEKINNSDGKVLLLVSGSVADVGVDFSGGQEVYFYNEPWTMYDKRQQLGRVFREGINNDLDVKTSVVKDSIEEGMYNYIRTKEKAIEKLLRGVPIANLEKELLKQNEKQPDLSRGVNEEIAEYYFSAWDKLLKFFGSVKEIGEKNFREFLENHGTEYAECYTDLEARSYQANASRINANVMDAMVVESDLAVDEIKILDIASGPEMLKNHIQEKYKDKVFSIDINKHHFKHKGDKRAVGSFSKLPIQEQSMNFVNFSFAAHYSKMLISENNFERLETFSEINRVLKVGGKAVINFIYSMDFKNQELFFENVKKMGFDIVSEYTGDVDGGNNYQSFMLTLQKTKDFDEDVRDFVDGIGAENTKGFKFVRSKEKKLKDSRMILKYVLLNGKKLSIAFNQKDSEIFAEEQYILKQAEILKGDDKIENINSQEIIDKEFVRVYNGKRYILFKKLKAGNGAVVIR